MSRYALLGARTGDLLTYGGRVLVHGNRAEMEYLFPSARIVSITVGNLGRPVMKLSDHPQLKEAGVRFPLRREDFVHA